MIVRQDPVKQAQLRLFHKPAERDALCAAKRGIGLQIARQAGSETFGSHVPCYGAEIWPKLKGRKEEVPYFNYLRIGNTVLAPQTVAAIIAERFQL